MAVDQLADEPALQAYHLLPSVRGELLIRLGRLDEARTELERAALLTRNEQDRRMLLTRAATLGQLGHRRSELVSSLLADLLDAASRRSRGLSGQRREPPLPFLTPRQPLSNLPIAGRRAQTLRQRFFVWHEPSRADLKQAREASKGCQDCGSPRQGDRPAES